MRRRTAIIVANGPVSHRPDLRTRLRQADLLICADGGLRTARRLEIKPDMVVGDLDSASPALVQWATNEGARVLRHPVEKDKIDAELALEAAIELGATDVEFIGALGGRVDQTLAAIGLLATVKAAGLRGRIIDGKQEVFLADRVTKIPGRQGTVVSLIPLSPVVTGVTLKGFRYPLIGATVRQGTTVTISNVIQTVPASVRVGRGRLLVVVNHR